MLRVTFAENGTKDDLLAAIRSVREHADVLKIRQESRGPAMPCPRHPRAVPAGTNGELYVAGTVGSR